MATYYWIGGTGTWDNVNTTNWSLTSGGLPGVAVPTSTDTVVFDSASGTGTCTTAAGSACSIATLNASTLGLTLGASHTMSGAFTLTLGTLSLGANTLTCSTFSSNNSNTRSIDFGTGKIVVTGNNATVYTTNTATNLSMSGSKNVEFTYAGSTGTRTISLGAVSGSSVEANSPNISITAGTDIVSFGTNKTVNSLNFTGFSGTYSPSTLRIFGDLVISSGMTISAATTALTLGATSGTRTITTNGNATIDVPITFDGVGGSWQLVDNLTTGSTRAVTLTNGALDLNNNTLSCGIFSSNNSNTRSIAFGTGNITLTGSGATIWSQSTATGFTYTGTPTVNCTYSGSTGTRTLSPGNTGLDESNALSFNISAGTDTVGNTGGHKFKNLNFAGFTGTLTNTGRIVYGNLTLDSGMTLSAGTGITTFAATSGTKTITTAGKTIDNPIVFDGVGGTWSFADALTQGSTRAFTITNGTVKLKAGATSTVGAFATSGSNQKYLQSTTAGSQATLSQASGTVTVSYLSIKDIAATGGATWNAYVDYNNVDQGDNTGWDFSYSPAIDNEFPVALRSFTQPKRF